jgi:predicted GNAT family N-acyltransferase
MTVSVRRVITQAALDTCLRLRWTVFVEEQGVPPSLERDEHDRLPAAAGDARGSGSSGGGEPPIHALATLPSPFKQAEVPAGAGRVTWPAPGVAKVQRMAVIDDARGKGVGAALLAFLEGEARKAGATRFTLGAQLGARGFYEKAGYRAVGEVFLDAGIEHVTMEKRA